MFKHALAVAAATLSLAAASHAGPAPFDFTTILNYTPSPLDVGGGQVTSGDAADGNQLLIEWSTSLSGGIVTTNDLTELKFTLNGSGGLIFEDYAIQSGVVQSLGGYDRSADIPAFVYNLSTDPTGGASGLFFAASFGGNGSGPVSPLDFGTIGEGSYVFQVLPGAPAPFGEVAVVSLATSAKDPFIDFSASTTNLIDVVPVPLPASGLVMLAGLTGFGALRRVRAKRA